MCPAPLEASDFFFRLMGPLSTAHADGAPVGELLGKAARHYLDV